MKTTFTAAAILAATTTLAGAAGLDRSRQDIGILFEDHETHRNYVELSFGYTAPSVDGNDSATGGSTGNIGDNFLTAGFGLKYQLNDAVSLALVIDEPYGSDTDYPTPPLSVSLGGTSAIVDSTAVTGIARYKFNENWSVYGGLRYQELSASVTLRGGAYGGLNGYNAEFRSDGSFGYLIGAAYEVPDIALRVALTYNSEIDHDLPTVERLNGAVINPPDETKVTTPENISLDFQTGVAPGTLVFGGIRYVHYSQTVVSPTAFDANTPGDNTNLADLENGIDVSLGVARQFSDKWAGSVAVGYSTLGQDDKVSPLTPVNGRKSITMGVRYTPNEKIVLSGGVRYTNLGDAFPQTAGAARADFSDNSAVSVGLSLGYRF